MSELHTFATFEFLLKVTFVSRVIILAVNCTFGFIFIFTARIIKHNFMPFGVGSGLGRKSLIKGTLTITISYIEAVLILINQD